MLAREEARTDLVRLHGHDFDGRATLTGKPDDFDNPDEIAGFQFASAHAANPADTMRSCTLPHFTHSRCST